MVNLVTLRRGSHKSRGKGRGGIFQSEPLFAQGAVGTSKINGTLLPSPSDRSEGKIVNFGGFVSSKNEKPFA